MRMHILLAVDAALLAAILLVSGLLLYRSHNRERSSIFHRFRRRTGIPRISLL